MTNWSSTSLKDTPSLARRGVQPGGVIGRWHLPSSSRRTAGRMSRRQRGEWIFHELHLPSARVGRMSEEGARAINFLTTTIMTNASLRDSVALNFLLPTTSNNGVPFADSRFAELERRVVDLTGGITRLGEVEGVWRNPSGILQRERSRAYTTTVDAHLAERVAAEVDVLIRSLFNQFAAYVQVTATRATAF